MIPLDIKNNRRCGTLHVPHLLTGPVPLKTVTNGARPVRSRARVHAPGGLGPVTSNGGFIALMSAIIISVVLLIVVVSVSTGGYISRFNILDSELKETSIGLAEACADTAILRLAADPDYTGGESIPVGDSVCEIQSVSVSWPKIVNIQAEYKKSYTNLELILTNATDPISVTSWKECKTLSPCAL